MANWQPYYYSFDDPNGRAGISESIFAPRNMFSPSINWTNNPVFPGGNVGVDVTDPELYGLMQSNPGLANYINTQMGGYNPSLGRPAGPYDFSGSLDASGMTPEQVLAYLQSNYGGDASRRPDIVTGANGQRYLKQYHDISQSGGLLDKITSAFEPALALSGFAGPSLGAGGAFGAAAGDLAGLAGATGIPELGLIANPATANAAVAAGIPSSMLGGGAGALGLGDFAGTGAGQLVNNPTMPPATPELAANNAVPGAVTGASGLNNAVTAGAAGTSGALGAGATAGLSAAASTALGRIFDGTATAGDWASVLGNVGIAGLGAYSANQQANRFADLANEYKNFGAPYRERLAQSYADPANFLKNSPDIQAAVQQGTDALGRSLSVQGNPFGNGSALQQMQNYATNSLYGQLGNERNRLANFGGLSTFNAAAPNMSTASAATQGGVANAVGYGLQNLTQPRYNVNDLWRSFGFGGLT